MRTRPSVISKIHEAHAGLRRTPAPVYAIRTVHGFQIRQEAPSARSNRWQLAGWFTSAISLEDFTAEVDAAVAELKPPRDARCQRA